MANSLEEALGVMERNVEERCKKVKESNNDQWKNERSRSARERTKDKVR